MTWWPFSTASRMRLPDSFDAPSYPWPQTSEREKTLLEDKDTLRRVIANLQAQIESLTAINETVCNERDEAKADLSRAQAENVRLYRTGMDHALRLGQIARLETPRASHSLKKAVAIARGEK